MSFNPLEKISVVHSDRSEHTYLKSSDQLSSLYRGEVKSYESRDSVSQHWVPTMLPWSRAIGKYVITQMWIK
jgi:hypothetical protein